MFRSVPKFSVQHVSVKICKRPWTPKGGDEKRKLGPISAEWAVLGIGAWLRLEQAGVWGKLQISFLHAFQTVLPYSCCVAENDRF